MCMKITRYSFEQKLSNKQSAKVICRFGSLNQNSTQQETISHIGTGNLMATHTFDCTVLRVNHGWTSCEDLATALQLDMYYKLLN